MRKYLLIIQSANNYYTEFFLADRKRLLVSRTLKEVEDMLADYSFLRVHNSYIVNLRIKNELFASLAF